MKTYDTTPGPHFLLAMQNQKWTIGGAIAELVDNSFGSARGNAKRCVITYDTRHRRLTVLDDGRGMDSIGRLFRLGDTIGRAPGDIGIYGAGGTMALLWLAQRVQIWTLRKGQVSRDIIDWKETIFADRFPQVSDEWERASISNTPSELLDLGHGTMIRMALQDERSLNGSALSNVQRDLASTYGPAMRGGKTLIWETIGKNGGRRALADEEVELAEAISINGAVEISMARSEADGSATHLYYTGRIGIVEGAPLSRSNIAIGFGIRRIKQTRDCFGSQATEEHYTGSGVCGYIDLADDWQPFLSTTKDDVNDARVWDALMSSVFDAIRPLLRKCEDEKLSVVLDDLAMQLQAAFDGQADVEVRTSSEPGGIDVYGPGVGPRSGTGTKPGKHRTATNEDGEDAASNAPAATKLTIVKADDEFLEQALCAFQDVGGEYAIYVNKDHRDVREALMARPSNRLALLMMINSEIAASALADAKLRKALFKPKAIERIENTGASKHSLLCRILMDRVLRPAAKEAA